MNYFEKCRNNVDTIIKIKLMIKMITFLEDREYSGRQIKITKLRNIFLFILIQEKIKCKLFPVINHRTELFNLS